MSFPRTGRPSWRLRSAIAGSATLLVGFVLGETVTLSATDVPADHAAQMASSTEIFTTHVRAILTQHCLKCHGGEKTNGELDLATREGLLKGGEQGPAVVAGKPNESLLLRLIRHEEEPQMPQDAAKLPDAAIEQITAWVASGAAYDKPLVDTTATLVNRKVTEKDREFWSFQPLATPTVPAVRSEAWCRTPVDQFVLSALEAKSLAPNGPADRRKLIRRAYFDLLGLPPTPAEVEAFVADPATDAYDRLVDRLLASPHYGERWGRHWLDLARFAESHGYEQDYDRPAAYHYRDFVIQALNADMPFDRFVRLQIAGDELEPDNNQALMATGFLAAGTHATQITANQVEKERYDELDDMAATVGTAMLGLTIGCARCHDHKFDPIPQADYYRVVSTFTTTVRSEVELDFHLERYRAAKAAFDRDHGPLVDALAKFENQELPSRFAAFLAAPPKPMAPKWLIVDAASTKSDGAATFTPQSDGSYLVGGKNAPNDVYMIVVQTKRQGITAVRLEALADDLLPKRGPGRAPNGNFALSDLQLWVAAAGAQGPGAPVKLTHPIATFSQEGLAVASAIDDNKKSAWAVDPQVGQNQAASFEIDTPVSNPQGTTLTFTLKFENNAGHNLGRFRLSLSTAAKPVGLDGDEAPERRVDEVNQALTTPAAERTEAQRATLLDWYRRQDETWQKLNGAMQEHAIQAPKPELTKVMIASEGLPAIRFHTQGADFFDKTYYLPTRRFESKSRRSAERLLASPGARAGRRTALARDPAGRIAAVAAADRTGPLDYRRQRRRRPPAGPGDRQSALAAPPGPRTGGHTQRFRCQRAAAVAPGVARLPGWATHRRRLAAQGRTQTDHGQRRLHAVGWGRRLADDGRSGQHPALAPFATADRGRSDSRRDAGSQWTDRRTHVRARLARRGATAPQHLLYRQAQSAGAEHDAL